MSPSLSRAARVAAAAVAVTVVSAGAASAATLTVKDHTGDTYRTTDADNATYTPSGSRLNTDLKRTVVRHGSRRVEVTAYYVDLKRTGDPLFFFTGLRTDEGVKRQLVVQTLTGPRGGSELERPNGDAVRCSGVRHTIDYTKNTVQVSVPRTCLSSPRWVQATVGALSMNGKSAFYVDNGHNQTSDEPTTWTARIRKG